MPGSGDAAQNKTKSALIQLSFHCGERGNQKERNNIESVSEKKNEMED